MTRWIKTSFKGVRFREHPTRKHGKGMKDRYFTIRYQKNGKRVEEGIGWASEIDPKDQKHWTPEKAAVILAELKEAAQGLKEGPSRLSEKREKAKLRKEEETAEKKRVEKEQVTFSKYFEKTYLPISQTGKKKDTARKEQEHSENWISPVIGTLPFKEIKPFNLEKIKKNLLDDGKSPRTIQYVFATVRQVWNMARRDGLVNGDSPTKNVKIPKIDNKRVRFLNHDEAETLLNSLKGRDSVTYEMALLSLHCGLRFGEIANLKKGHIDTDRQVIDVVDPKGGKGRVAYMTHKVTTMLKHKLQKNKKLKPEDFIFTKDGEKLNDTPREFSKVVADLKFNEGITDPRRKVVFHTLRHTFASWHVMAGTDIYTLKELLGHAVIQMTIRYSHLSNKTLQNATANFEKANRAAKKDGEVVQISEN